MPAASQKVLDYTLVGIKNAHCFLDYIIIVSRGSIEDHLNLICHFKKNLMRIFLELIYLNVTFQ